MPGFWNLILFCRTVAELLRVKQAMSECDLRKGLLGLEIYLMAELPSNINLAREFARHIDGFSIGRNDLTQLSRRAAAAVGLWKGGNQNK